MHFRVTLPLQENSDVTQRDLADRLGMSVSVSGLNHCPKALIDKGFVKMGNFSKSKNKYEYVYLLTPKGSLRCGADQPVLEAQDGRVRFAEVGD